MSLDSLQAVSLNQETVTNLVPNVSAMLSPQPLSSAANQQKDIADVLVDLWKQGIKVTKNDVCQIATKLMGNTCNTVWLEEFVSKYPQLEQVLT